MSVDEGAGQVAAKVRLALSTADLAAFAELLHPNVTWGAPGDPSPPCQSRAQVLEWYSKGRAEGRRATVLEVSCHGDKVLVAMTVTAGESSADEGEAERWQVLTVAAGQVTDIRGYDRRQDAHAAAGIGG